MDVTLASSPFEEVAFRVEIAQAYNVSTSAVSVSYLNNVRALRSLDACRSFRRCR